MKNDRIKIKKILEQKMTSEQADKFIDDVIAELKNKPEIFTYDIKHEFNVFPVGPLSDRRVGWEIIYYAT